MIETAFRALILANTAVFSLVDSRVFFGLRPENERRACIVLSLVSSVPSYTMAGRGGTVTGRMQCNCLATTYGDAKTLADAVRAAVDGYSGNQYGSTICWIEIENIRDTAAAPLVGSGTQATFGVQLDCQFMVKE